MPFDNIPSYMRKIQNSRKKSIFVNAGAKSTSRTTEEVKYSVHIGNECNPDRCRSACSHVADDGARNADVVEAKDDILLLYVFWQYYRSFAGGTKLFSNRT